MKEILECINANERLDVLNMIRVEWLCTCSNRDEPLAWCEIISLLPQNEQLAVFLAVLNNSLPSASRYTSNWTVEKVLKIAEVIGASVSQLDLLLQCKVLVETYNDLISMLNRLPEEKRFDLLQGFGINFIASRIGLTMFHHWRGILSLLPKEQRENAFLLALDGILANKELYSRIDERSVNIAEVLTLVEMLEVPVQITVLLKLEKLITGPSRLIKVLNSLPECERFNFIRQYDSIQPSVMLGPILGIDTAGQICRILAKADQAHFLPYIKRQIGELFDLLRALNTLDENLHESLIKLFTANELTRLVADTDEYIKAAPKLFKTYLPLSSKKLILAIWLEEYIKERVTEPEQNQAASFLFSHFSKPRTNIGCPKSLKIAAATKLLNMVQGFTTEALTAEEGKALNQGRLRELYGVAVQLLKPAHGKSLRTKAANPDSATTELAAHSNVPG